MTDRLSLFSGHYATPHDTLPFDRITVADIKPALLHGMELERAEVKAITDNPAPPTFENTIVAFEQTGSYLGNVEAYMYNRLSADTCDELDELAQEMAPVLSEHSSAIMLDEKLFERVSAVWNDKALHPSDKEDMMLLTKVYDAFERSGATLPEDKKARFRAVRAELSELSLLFSQNNLKETNAWHLHVENAEELKGLPELPMAQAAEAARERGLEGWVLTLHAPSYVPAMTYVENREIRQRLYMAYNTRCTADNEQCNFEVVRRLVNLRCELAQILGYPTYADYVLKNRMARSVEGVYGLLRRLIDAYLPHARREVADVAQLAHRREGADFSMKPWDFSFYANLLQKERFEFDAEMLRPYFGLSFVIEGVFGLATRLYGITFKANRDIPVYHPDVVAYEVFDKDGTYLAVLYADFHPRASKQSGAWMTNYKEEWGGTSRPHVAVNMNFGKATEGKPSLLTLSEVETFLHEFGHALHGIFARTRYRSMSGTNVYWDFVELPSQFMENYAVEPEFLKTFARHYETGELLPDELIERVRNSRNFNAAYACMRQVSFGLLDMAYYTRTAPLAGDIRDFEREAWQEVQLLPPVPEANMSVQFGHIMSGGYSAGYYSYKWAEVLDADAFSHFKEKGVFNREVADSFRQNVLSQGGTRPPMDLYRAFRGQEPTIEALLERNGLKK